jgi:3-dehydroquinate dehydratase II
MKILILNGPNLNMLGKRNQTHYGTFTLDEINGLLSELAKQMKVQVTFFQTNHEGKLIDFIQKHAVRSDGILINPAAFTHYSIALADALRDTKLPVVEVHLSDMLHREPFRKIDVLDGIVIDRIMGLKEQGYLIGLKKLVFFIKKT